MDRTILHSDMNSCYASIELLHHPELRGKPLAVGGDPEARHGIILAKDQLAKKAGVKTGMALWQARQVCPEINILMPRMELKLNEYGIDTIGDLALASHGLLHGRLGKMGLVLSMFAKGDDMTPVGTEGGAEVPIKSIGNSTTTPRDLVNEDDVRIVIFLLSESVAARLRENNFAGTVVEISVRDNELSWFTRQRKLKTATDLTSEIAKAAM